MPILVDTLYTDMELRTQKFDAQVRAADQQISALGKKLDTALPNATAVASGAVSDWSQGMAKRSNEAKEALSKSIDRTIYKFEQLAAAVDRNDRAAVNSLRKRAQATQERFTNIGASAEQLAGIGAVIGMLGAKSDDAGTKIDAFGKTGKRATLALASGFETMGRVGTEGIGALKGGISQFAFLLGPGGVLAGALVFAVSATVEYFNRARAESEKTKRKLLADLLEEYDARRRLENPIGLARNDQATARENLADAERRLKEQQDAQELANTPLRARVKLNEELNREIGKAQRELIAAIQRETDAENQLKDAEAQRYGTLIKNQQASKAEQAKAVALLATYRAELKATTGEDTKAQEKRIALLGRISAITGESIATATRKAETEQRSDNQLDQQQRDLLQKITDVDAAAKKGEITLAQYDQQQRELADGEADLIAKMKLAGESAAGFDEKLLKLKASTSSTRDALKKLEIAKVAQDFRQLEASLTVTAVDDLQVAYDMLAEKIKKASEAGTPVDPALAKSILALQDQRIKGAEREEAIEKRIREILKKRISDYDAQLALQFELEKLRKAEAAITATDEVSEADRAQLLKLIATLEAEIAKLKGKSVAAGAQLATNTEKAANAIASAAQFAYGLASALLGADSSITRMIGGAASVASGFREIAKLAKDAGSFEALLSGGSGGIAAALPAAGAIVGGVLAIKAALGDSAEKKAQRDLLARNNEQLEKLRNTIGDALQLSQSGRTISGLSRAFSVSGIDTDDSLAALQRLLAELKKLGLTFEDLRKFAAESNLELSENPTLEQLRQVSLRLREIDFAAFGAGFAGAMRRLEAEARMDPKAFDGIDGLIKRLRVLAGADGSDLFAPILALVESGDIEGAIAKAMELFAGFSDLKAADFQGLSPKEFLDAIVDLVAGLRENIPAAKTAVDLFQEAVDALDAAFEALAAAFEFGAVDVQQRLAGTFDALKKFFPDLAAQVDFSSADAFKASIARIVAAFSADGVLTEAEKAQLAILRELAAAFEGVTDAAQEAADAAQREADEKKRSEEERERDRKAREAELARVEEERRRRVLRLAEAYIQVNNVEDPLEQLRIRVAALGEAFPELAGFLDDFNLKTKDGADALEKWIEEMLKSPESLQMMADLLGLSLDDLIAYLLDLERSADAAGTHIASLAQQLSAAFSDVEFDLDLEGVTDPLERLARTAKAAAGADAKIKAALGSLDLSTAEGRKSAEAALIALGKSATDQATRDAALKLVQMIRGIPAAGAGDGAGTGAGSSAASPTKDGSDTGRATFIAEDLRFDRLLDYQAQQVAWLQIIAKARSFEPIYPPRMPVGFGSPSIGAAATMAAGGGNNIFHVSFAGATFSVRDVDEARETITPAIYDGMMQAAGRQFTVHRQLKGRGVR